MMKGSWELKKTVGFFLSLSRSSVWNCSETGLQRKQRKQKDGGDAQD